MSAPSTIDRDELARLRADASADLVLVDTRPARRFALAHLPGAVNRPLSEGRLDVSDWRPDKRYVVYGTDRAAGKRLAAALAETGLAERSLRVEVYEDGFRDWVAGEQPTEPPVHGWACMVCSYGYYAHRGDVRAGAPPGTLFEELPADWRCPWCGAPKERFVRE